MSVLIFGTKADIHVRAVAWALGQQGIDVQLIDYLSFPSKRAFSYYPGDEKKQKLYYSNNGEKGVINIGAANIIWCRRMLTEGLDYSCINSKDIEIVKRECRAYIIGMWHLVESIVSVNNVTWVNPLSAQEAVKCKARQIQVAKKVGFNVPNTLMSNDPKAVREFYHGQDGEIIFKPYYQNYWLDAEGEKYQVTAKLKYEHLEDDMAIMLCPGIYQQYFEKRYELRVLVVGEFILAAKLDSQVNQHTIIDWRLDVFEGKMPIERYALDEEIKNRIILFMKAFDIEFGSFDFIVTNKNEIIFLEINEQGQFLFLESRCPELATLSTVCGWLANISGCSQHVSWPSYADFKLSGEYKKCLEDMKALREGGQ